MTNYIAKPQNFNPTYTNSMFGIVQGISLLPEEKANEGERDMKGKYNFPR